MISNTAVLLLTYFKTKQKKQRSSAVTDSILVAVNRILSRELWEDEEKGAPSPEVLSPSLLWFVYFSHHFSGCSSLESSLALNTMSCCVVTPAQRLEYRHVAVVVTSQETGLDVSWGIWGRYHGGQTAQFKLFFLGQDMNRVSPRPNLAAELNTRPNPASYYDLDENHSQEVPQLTVSVWYPVESSGE